MRIPKTEHTSRPWRIHEIAGDFTVEDVWELPTPGGPDDLARVLDQFSRQGDPSEHWSWPARALWGLRWKLGELFGWDKPDQGLDARVPTLRDRLPADLRDGPTGPETPSVPFTPLYLTHDEWAAEMANRTVHGIMHIGWVQCDDGRYRARMAVLVKPNGLFGRAYMAAILPFRYLIVYPQLMRAIEKQWQAA